ncbi:hypothetical protein ACHAW5_001741 [Stephanodiscus triporus]|uniref:Uncharacterized protein n=1 Tax=Stephanodiscus triporus TaxID=2934178 RepID=A0ABD3QU89_9STRA
MGRLSPPAVPFFSLFGPSPSPPPSGGVSGEARRGEARRCETTTTHDEQCV